MWTRLCLARNGWVLLVCTMAAGAAAAPVYECRVNGRAVYSQQPGPNCRAADLSGSGFYTAPPNTAQPANSDQNRPANNAPLPPAGADTATPNAAKIQAAQAQLAQARRNLEAGRQVRYGNERNYAKYLARIAALEAEVQKSEAALQNLQNPQ